MAQAIERRLATPKTIPNFPFSKDIRLFKPVERRPALDAARSPVGQTAPAGKLIGAAGAPVPPNDQQAAQPQE